MRSEMFGHVTTLAISLLIVACVILILPGCGGGTRGTGDDESTLTGYILNTSGKPIANLHVTQTETGDATETDANGYFNLPVALENNSVTLLVEGNSFSATQQIANLDSTQAVNSVVITIDEVDGIIESVELGTISVDPTPLPSNQVYTQKIYGTVSGRNGTGIAKVTMSIDGVSGRDITDSKGEFSLSTKARSRKVKLRVAYHDLKGSLDISGLPTDRNSKVEVNITLSIESSQPGKPVPDHQELKLQIGSVHIR